MSLSSRNYVQVRDNGIWCHSQLRVLRVLVEDDARRLHLAEPAEQLVQVAIAHLAQLEGGDEMRR